MEKFSNNPSKVEGPFSHISDKPFYESNPKATSSDALERMKKDYWEKRKTEEYQEWEKRLKPIIDYFCELRDSKIESTEKVIVIGLGGGLAASLAAGQLRGLELAGITPEIFKGKLDLYGISGGSGPITYYATGETQKAVKLFSEKCTTDEFLNFKRVHQMLDTKVIAREMRNGPMHLDTERLRKFEGSVYAVAQNKETGENELLDLKTATPGPVDALEASSAIPGFRSPVTVNDKRYIDGGFEIPPLEEIIKKSGATKVLILPNTPFDHFGEPGYGIAGKLAKVIGNLGSLGSIGTLKTLEAQFTELARFKEFLDLIEEHTHAQIAILWPQDAGVGTLTKGKTELDDAMLRSARETIGKFGGKQPEVEKILPSYQADELKEAA